MTAVWASYLGQPPRRPGPLPDAPAADGAVGGESGSR